MLRGTTLPTVRPGERIGQQAFDLGSTEVSTRRLRTGMDRLTFGQDLK